MANTLQAPPQQTQPQETPLDQLLAEQLGYSLIEGNTTDDYLPSSPVGRLDPNAMVASLTGRAGREAAQAAAEAARKGMTGENPKAVTDALQELPERNAFSQSLDDPQSMADPTVAPTADSEIPQDAMGAPALKPEEVQAIDMQESMRTMQPVQGARGGDRNMQFNFIDDTEDRKLAELINRGQQGFKNIAERKVQTHAETLRLSETQETMRKVLNKRVDQRWEPEELAFLQQTIKGTTTRLNEMSKEIAQQVREGGVDVVDGKLLTSFDLLMKRNIAAQQTASGVLSQAGRLLNASRAVNSAPSGNEYYKRVAESMELSGGRDAIIQRALNIEKSGGTEAEVADIVRQSWKEKAWNGALKVRYNMMLSSVRTHAANLVSSQMLGVMEVLPYKGMASLNSNIEYGLRKAIPNMEPLKPEDRVGFVSELPSAVSGIIAGARDGLVTAKQIAKGDIIGDGKYINEMGIRYGADEVPENALLRAGTLPTRLLEAEDAFNKSIFFNMKVRELAYRKAQASDDPAAAYQELLANPDESMIDEAGAFAAKSTFTNNPDIYGNLIGSTARVMADATTENPFFKVIIPFVKTPANIMGYAFETTGLNAVISPEGTYNKIVKGSPAERADALARIEVAAGLWYLLYDYWQAGNITGMGSDNPAVNRAREAQGWQPNSIRVNGNYVALNRADPMGMTLGMMASGFDAFANQSNGNQMATTAATIVSVADMLQDRSYLSGISDVVNIMNTGSVKSAESFALQQGLSFITPNILRDAREATDPLRRELAFDPYNSGAIQARLEKYLKNSVPEYSKSVPPSVDVNGNYISNGGQWYWRAFVPLRVTEEEKQDPVAAVYMYHQTPVEKPDYIITIPKTGGVQINTLMMDGQKGWLYHEYQRQVGIARHEAMTEFLHSDEWKELVKADQIGAGSPADEVIRSLVAQGKKVGTQRFLESITGKSTYQPTVNGKPVGDPVEITQAFTQEDLELFAQATAERTVEDDPRAQQLQESGVYKKPQKAKVGDMPQSSKELINKTVEF